MVGVGTGGHALANAGMAKDFTEDGTAVLAASVAVEDWLLSGAACVYRLSEGIDGKFARRCSASAQPMILREQRSMTTAR